MDGVGRIADKNNTLPRNDTLALMKSPMVRWAGLSVRAVSLTVDPCREDLHAQVTASDPTDS